MKQTKIAVSKLRPFENNPYQVRDDAEMNTLIESIQAQPKEVPVFGTFLDGENLYAQELSTNGIIIMGNEGNGISPQVAQSVNRRLLIPNYPQGQTTSESLNVAVATAIVCAEFRRRS